MKEFDNIEDWYREELNNYNVDPDESLWDALSDDLDADMTLTDENISDWYKREVNKLEERPDYTVWEKLATRLDTATVWDKLVVSLNRYDQLIWWRNTILKGSAILLLLAGSYQIYSEYYATADASNLNKGQADLSGSKVLKNKSELIPLHRLKSEKSSRDNQEAIKVIRADDESEARNSPIKSKRIESKIQNQSSSKKVLNTQQVRVQNRSKEGVQVDFNKEKISPVSSKTYSASKVISSHEDNAALAIGNRRIITEEDISHTFAASDFLVKKEKDKIVFNSKRFSSHFTYGLYARRFYVGLNLGVKKQGLITQINKSGLFANTNQIDYLDFGYNFGLTGGFILSDNVNLESTINVISTSGYKRKFSSEGFSRNSELDLNYTSINLMAKKMNTKSTFDNKVYSTNLIGGVYLSYLHSGETNTYGNATFNSLDYGVVLGLEQDRYLSKSVIITPGFRYNQGLSNVFADGSVFNYGYNFSLEFNIGVKYIFLKKGK